MSKSVFTTSDLSRKSGDIIAEAMRHPVTITQRNKPRFVLLNVEDYERLREYADHRQVLTPETIDEELMAKIEAAVEAYAKSEN